MSYNVKVEVEWSEVSKIITTAMKDDYEFLEESYEDRKKHDGIFHMIFEEDKERDLKKIKKVLKALKHVSEYYQNPI
jgi:hypothetical protein